MDDEKEKIAIDLTKEVISSYRREYEEKSDDFRELDKKAQVTIAISVGFLGFSLNLLKDPSFLSTPILQLIFFINIIALTVAAVMPLVAMFMAEVATAPTGSEIEKRYETIAKDLQSVDQNLRTFYTCQFKLWQDGIDEHFTVNERKANSIKLAQRALVASIFTSALMSLISLGNIGSTYYIGQSHGSTNLR